MKTFNITAQAYDLCASNPKQSILINEIIESTTPDSAQDLFKLNLLIEDVIVTKILSVEEISKVAS